MRGIVGDPHTFAVLRQKGKMGYTGHPELRIRQSPWGFREEEGSVRDSKKSRCSGSLPSL